jgi:hypothetical protein
MHVFLRIHCMNEYTQFYVRLIYLSNARYKQDMYVAALQNFQ